MTTKQALPKHALRALRQKEKFVIERIQNMPLEHSWALKGTKLPPRLAVPPRWVPEAVRIVDATKFQQLNQLKPQDGKATYPQLLEILGIGAAHVVVLNSPLDAFPEDTPAEVKASIIRLAKVAKQNLKPELRRIEKSLKRVKETTRPATLSEFQANSAAFSKGATTKINENESARVTIGQLLWFFWPCLKGARTARELYESISTVTDLKFGWKNFEDICGELKIFEGKRGRPRAIKS